jgi:matrixin/putative Ig domain-containing protein
VVCLSLAPDAFATTAVLPTDQAMVIESRRIITGRVTEVSSALDPTSDLVYTYVTVFVDECLKGRFDEREIVLRELGGEASGRGTLIYGSARFQVGENVLLYLDTWRDGALRVHQGFLGKFGIVSDSSGQLSAVRQEEGDGISIVPTPLSAATSRSPYDSYKAQVQGLLEANATASIEFERTYYSGVPALSTPPDYETRNKAVITPFWALANPSQPARWFEPDSGQSVVFYVNPANAPSSAIVDDMLAALNTWSTSAGSSIQLRYGGETSGYGVQRADGQNTISFNNGDGYFAPSTGCDGLLAVSGIVRYSTSQTRTINGRNFGKAVEANVSFNPYLFCWFANRCQIQEVATHELGHAIGLGHSGTSSAVMNAYAHFDNRCASLTDDDTAGAVAVYPGSVSRGSLSIATRSDLPAGKMNSPYGVHFEAAGGAGSYSWSLLDGQLCQGMTLSPSGFLFGTPSAAASVQFTVRVRDASGNSSQQSMSLVVQPPPPAPQVTAVQYKKRKLMVYGVNFEEGSTVYIDEQSTPSSLDAGFLLTKKRRLAPGSHAAYVVNYDGKQSNRIVFSIE